MIKTNLLLILFIPFIVERLRLKFIMLNKETF
jgi:hypothetical protein